LYSILQKLEQDERIEPQDVAWLQENELFYDKIRTKYHIIEADFYQQELKRTGNQWNLVNASSHLRKADKSKLALQLTNNLPLNKIEDNKLKSALLTTRGGAFRDFDKLDDAEICARQAMKYQPDSHHPYTLMGAICYQQGKYFEGDKWFSEAIKRGAKPLDMDSEIKSVLKKTNDQKQRQELVNYLLKKDSYRYAWAKDYLKKQKDKK
jgi:tetratricopeptide (TPR) repeat protein